MNAALRWRPPGVGDECEPACGSPTARASIAWLCEVGPVRSQGPNPVWFMRRLVSPDVETSTAAHTMMPLAWRVSLAVAVLPSLIFLWLPWPARLLVLAAVVAGLVLLL